MARDDILIPPFKTELFADPIRPEEIAGLPGALDKGVEDIDPVTFSVVYARVEGIMTEMTQTILATARNPILHGAKDFTCCLLDTYGASILSMVDCIPVHVGTMSPPLRFIIRAFGEDVHEGDVFLNNASYAGNSHVGDFTMFAPIFFEGKLVAWACSKCHLLDIGAHLPTSMDPFAKDIYEEGYHFPGVRLCRDHKPISDLVRFIAYNFRYPQQWHGDFLAQLSSLWVAEARVIELCQRFGYDTFKGCLTEALRYGERAMREEISKLPKITVTETLKSECFENYIDEALEFKMTLTIDPEEGYIDFDYSEMPDQIDFSYNLSYATCRCSAIQGTLPVLSPDLPYNSGALDRIRVKQREGAIAGIPRWPVGTEVATVGLNDEVTNLVFKTWAKVLPHRALAGMGEHPAANHTGAGVDPRKNNQPYGHLHYLAASAAGATEGYDGLPHMFGHCIMGNMGYESLEIHEQSLPRIIWEVKAEADSGGAGKWRGGIAMSHRLQPIDHDMQLIYCGTGHTWPAFGLFGGDGGTVADHWLLDAQTQGEEAHLENMGEIICRRDQHWYAKTGGGGGFGNPLERDPEKVRDDARDGFISLEAARDVYGVVLDTEPELFAVDAGATEALRAEMTARGN
ncbi:hydantoinase B/oxoprolinase family protein [Aureimonas psammosilenae]|uniref:hydantoinase B/oxoprolinase family protein n=1 Tax=Aureimonas psammosilenae TaxID=2495496 RepID=UPI0012608191|nr:hydantoinase B/oxoprolinase family protein [Aureimonas psammosilenae]